MAEAYDGDGRLVSRVPLAGGRPHGRFECFHPDGSLRLDAEYEHGELAGLLRAYAAASPKK